MVRRWRDRWAALALILREELSAEERLADLPRPGAPARITADQFCRIVALACEDPEDTGRPISQWTGREIADEVKKRNIVKEISPRHARKTCCSTSNAPLRLIRGSCAGTSWLIT